MVDRIFSQEDREIEELVSLMQHTEKGERTNQLANLTSDYGSDEEEYDQLFMEVMSKIDGNTDGTAYTALEQDQEMDVS